MSHPLILRLDINGLPVNWIHWQEAACLYASDRVAWTAGDNVFALRGGYSRSLERQTLIYIHSIVAIKGEYRRYRQPLTPPLTNRELFRRDGHVCMYCGKSFRESDLTRDHVLPISRGGKNHWSNVISACRRCNTHKGSLTPDEANMPLLAVPYIPNLAEYLFLRNRRILADQMDFLKTQFRHGERLLPNQQCS